MMELETEDSVFTCIVALRGKESYPVRLVHVKPHLPHIITMQLKTESFSLRLMVGHLNLSQIISVRILEGDPIISGTGKNLVLNNPLAGCLIFNIRV
jgi:hypothetical protein